MASQNSKTKEPVEIMGADPEQIGMFPGGTLNFNKYINENVTSKINLTKDQLIIVQKAYAKFIIDEKGNVDSVRIIRTSNIPSIDSIFVSALSQMPKWTPSTFNGKPHKQEFNFPLNICFK